MIENVQDFFLHCSDCVLENPRSFYGNFSLGPFKNSQSLTVANALRRTLLAELSGIAITHVEIDGAFHEYSTLDGVRESILDILLNFKQIVLKTSSPVKKPLYGYLKVRGPGIIRASDLKLPPGIQCVDPDQYVATLNENGKLSLKCNIADFENSLKNQDFLKKFSKNVHMENQLKKREFFENFQNKKEILNTAKEQKNQNFQNQLKTRQSLWVDPLFNPILKVNYLIETIEPLQPLQPHIPNQVVHIELWTNGSIHPRQAFSAALLYLKNMFEKLDTMKILNSQYTKKMLESEYTTSKVFKTFEYDFQNYTFLESKKFKRNSDSKLDNQTELATSQQNYLLELNNQLNTNSSSLSTISIKTLNFPKRISNCLIENNFLTIGDLLKYSSKELKQFSGLSNFALNFIQKKLKKLGLKLND